MKTIIISDTHLTHKFCPSKCIFLQSLVEKCDRLIINGDFWSKYSLNFDDFIDSEWKTIFPLFKHKKTIYVLGNHDLKEWIDPRVKLFSDKICDSFKFSEGIYKYNVVHGHQFYQNKLSGNVNLVQLEQKIHFDENFRYPVEKVLYKYFVNGKRNNLTRFANSKLKKIYKKNETRNNVVITGHTHFAENDKEIGFVNTGYINFNKAWWLEIDTKGYDLKYSTY